MVVDTAFCKLKAGSDKKVTEKYVNAHLKIGIASLNELINNGLTVKHIRF